mgnify:CR=1 FL=1
MSKTVHVETSAPSFFNEVRSEPEMVARRAWTRHCSAVATERYDLVTSPAVIDELERGEYPSRGDCLVACNCRHLINANNFGHV